MTNQRVAKWEHRLLKGIANEVYSMNLQRFAWKRIQEIVAENSDLKGVESYYWNFQFDIYARAQAGAVRRQSDVNDQTASLGQLLHEIVATPELLTRDWYVAHWGKDKRYDAEDKAYWKRTGENEWDKTFGGEVGDHIDPAVPRADLDELQEGSKKVRHYVDKHVAHFDASVIGRGDATKSEDLPTLDEVHDSIDLIGRVFHKYYGLFTAAGIYELTPILQHDWEAVFRVQWLPEPELPKELSDYRERRKREGVDLDAD